MVDFDREISELYPWILRMAKRFCYYHQDAEDLAGETVYKMLLNRDKFDNSKSMKPWCLAVMQNTYITQYNRSLIIGFTDYADVSEQSSSYSTSSLSALNEIFSVIRRCAQKSCCIESVIYCAKGYSYDEICEILHIPVGTVRSRIASGRKILFKVLDS